MKAEAKQKENTGEIIKIIKRIKDKIDEIKNNKMTEKEIRLELAKAALIGGASKERMESMFQWVTDGVSAVGRDLDDIHVSELSQYLGMSSVRFENRCRENDIHNIGQLVRIGSKNFRALRLVGSGLVMKITEVLREKFEIDEW